MPLEMQGISWEVHLEDLLNFFEEVSNYLAL